MRVESRAVWLFELQSSPHISIAAMLQMRLEEEPLDLAAEVLLIHFLAKVAPHVSLLHDAAEGGLAVALAECALASGVGADVELPPDATRLFGEGGGQAIVACAEEFAETLRGVPLRRLGVVGGDSICGVSLTELQEAWN